jgi:hypothetical protein
MSDFAKCLTCHREFVSSKDKCPYCNVALSKGADTLKGSPEWVNQSLVLLKKTLPKSLLLQAFRPDSDFYAQYNSRENKVEGLHYMAGKLFEWLNIKPNGCVVSFYSEDEMPSEAGKETAGWYTKIPLEGKETEVILVNSKHINSAFAVGAILAHEMMHLYLRRKNVGFEDRLENELLTDLATIQVGFGILVLNGMSYSNNWWLSIILIFVGIRYWHSEQLAFGYFEPKEYGRYALNYFHGMNLSTSDLFNYLNPSSRHFVPHSLFTRSNSPIPYIKKLESQNFKANLLKIGAVSIVLYIVLANGSFESTDKSSLSTQIETCKNEATSLENEIKTNENALKNMKFKLDAYESRNDAENFNSLVDPYNSLLSKVKSEYSQYDSKIDECNKMVDEYNNK